MTSSGATEPGREVRGGAHGREDRVRRGTPRPWTPGPGALALAAFALAGAWACARPSAPPGAEEESEPPAVRSLYPPLDTVIPGLGGRATVRFDEPVQAGAGLGRQLVASPAYRYEVTVGHSEISVRPEGGWRPGAVYVIQLPAGISDLLANAREEPVRMVFSTGPPISATTARARLFDRITGEELTDGRILYLTAVRDSVASAADTVPYTAVADSTGTYELRHLPPGEYRAFGFVDRNRNRRLDRRLEPFDSARVSLGSDSAEATVNLFALEPDSTAPLLGRVETPDSLTVRLVFDDHLRPGHEPSGLAVRRAEGGSPLPARQLRVLTAADTLERVGEAAADSARGDSARADTTPGAAASDSTVADSAARDTSAGDTLAAADTLAGDSAAVDTPVVEKPPLPTRIVEVRLAEPLTTDTFRIRLRGVRNMWGLESDVDTTFSYAPPVDTARADTAAGAGPAGTDTAGVQPPPVDTAADTAAARPVAGDTTAGGLLDALQPDSLATDSLPTDSAATDSAAADSATAAVPSDSLPPDSTGGGP